MKTITNKQLKTGKQIINQLGVNKTAVALTHYNVEKNNIDIRMFLYSDTKITLYTTGKLFLGTLKKNNMKFTFDPTTDLPFVSGCINVKTRVEVKDAIKTVLSTHADVLKMSNGYKNLINNVEDVLLYVIKSGIIKGSYLPLEAQLKYNWIMNPDTIIIDGESVDKKEIAVTNNTKTEGAITMNIMSVAHKLRKEMEIEDKEYASYSYKLRMKIALKHAWDTKVVVTKEAAITVDKVINIEKGRSEQITKPVSTA